MKILIVGCLLFMIYSFSIAQTRISDREEKLEQLKSRKDVIVTELNDAKGVDWIKIEYLNGKVLYKNIGDYKYEESRLPSEALAKEGIQNPVYSPTYDSTIIDLRFIDTTLYYHKYSYWQEVPIHNSVFDCLRIGDVNINEKTELYGMRKFFWSGIEPISIYELNNLGNFEFKYQYDSVFLARNIYDVDEDGQEEVLLTFPPAYDTIGNQQRFFSKPTPASFAEKLNFTFTYYGVQPNVGAQLNDITFGDFDSNGYTDMIFANSGYPDVHIFEFNPFINNFDSVYRLDVNELAPWDEGGFSVSDFDLDGKTDIVFGTGKGNVFVIENEGNNQYTNSWQGSVESYHAYIHTWSNDIDKNGKPEFWVLADAYYNGIGTTRITIFETNGNNSYQAVGRVDLVGIFSFYAGTMQAVDIDNDGIQEVAVCIDDNFLILKFNGSRDHHTYELYYIKQNELNTQGEFQVYVGAIMYDLQNTGEHKILISMYHSKEVQQNLYSTRYVTRIFKPDSTTIVNGNEIIPKVIELYQNYPNPFNPATKIRYSLKDPGNVSIFLYDMLGQKIDELINEEKPAGEFEIQINAEKLKLSSGTYIVVLKTEEQRVTQKINFIK
jgi:hypothetical protein